MLILKLVATPLETSTDTWKKVRGEGEVDQPLSKKMGFNGQFLLGGLKYNGDKPSLDL